MNEFIERVGEGTARTSGPRITFGFGIKIIFAEHYVAGHFHVDEDGAALLEMDQDVFGSALRAGNLLPYNFLFKFSKKDCIFYIIFAYVRDAAVVCPYV